MYYFFVHRFFRLRTSYENMMKLNFVKKDSIDSFRNFLKDTDGDLFYRIWLDIENLSMLSNDIDQKKY